MAHRVESMAFFGNVPWHGLGVQIPEEIRKDALECMKVAGLDWTISKRPVMFLKSDEKTIAYIPERHVIVRDSDDAWFAVVSHEYELSQNRDMFGVFQRVLNSGRAKIETCGSLKGGKIIWALAAIEDSEYKVTNNDAVKMYALLSYGHDGKTPISIGFTPIRVVCNNTLTAAFHNSKLLKLMHKGDLLYNMKEIVEVMDLATLEFKTTIDQYKFLLSKVINKDQLREYVKLTLNLEESEKNARATNIIDQVVHYAEKGRGNKEVAGTLWAAYNGVTEYLSYRAGNNQDSRFTSLWFGHNANVNNTALQNATNIATGLSPLA